jgi:predicted porin
MQKKIIALAIAAAISAPAFADNANVTVYGKAILDIERVSNDKSALSGATRVQTNATRLGFKGKEDLGDGMSGWYQYEVQIDADGNSGNGAGNGTRNSGLGVDTAFGTVMLGIWDTPFKVAHNKIELFDNTTVFSAVNLIGRAGGAGTAAGTASVANAPAANFVTRRSNVIQYWSPAIAGVKINVSFSPDEGGNGIATTQGVNKSQTSLSAVYDNHDNGIYVAAAYESRPDANATVFANAGTTDTASRLVARYTIGDIWLGATYEQFLVNTFTTSTTAPVMSNYTQSNMEVVANVKLGASSIGLSYAKNGETAIVATGATQMSARYGYNFSKRTEGFIAYTSLKNDTAGTYSLAAGTAFGAGAGSTSSAIGAGLVHSF